MAAHANGLFDPDAEADQQNLRRQQKRNALAMAIREAKTAMAEYRQAQIRELRSAG